MECRFTFCIYHWKNQCVLEKIRINEAGICDACIPVSLDTEMLEKEKERQLEKLEKRYKQTGL